MLRSTASKVMWVGRTTVLASAAILATIVLIGVGQGTAHADVTGVKGSAYGYSASVSLFDGPPNTREPSPSVTLPASGSPQLSASEQSSLVQFGPAIVFSSGPLAVVTQGSTGPAGSVSSSTQIENVNTDASDQEAFTADTVASRCHATESGISAETTISNGTLQTSDPNPYVTGDENVIEVPINPTPNRTFEGQDAEGEVFHYTFNEQIVNADGSITVYAVHQRFLGPTRSGDVYIGKSECGVVTGTPDTTAPRVVRTIPTTNATGIAPGANVKADFSEAMQAGSLNTNTIKLFKAGTSTPIGAVVSYDAETKKAVLNPDAKLRQGAKYKAVVTTGANDVAGNGLDQDPNKDGNQGKVWFFKIRN